MSGEPSSMIRLTISSANSGFPPERSATWRRSSPLPLPPRPRPGTGRPPARGPGPGPSGSSAIVVALRRPPPHPGRRSSSSSRARAINSSGPRTQRARYSIRSSMPSSAQWMSSIASTSGFCRHAALDQRAHGREDPVAHRLGVLGVQAQGRDDLGGDLDAERPGDQRRDALGRLLGDLLGDAATRRRCCSFPHASSESSVSTISNCPRITSPSAQ